MPPRYGTKNPYFTVYREIQGAGVFAIDVALKGSRPGRNYRLLIPLFKDMEIVTKNEEKLVVEGTPLQSSRENIPPVFNGKVRFIFTSDSPVYTVEGHMKGGFNVGALTQGFESRFVRGYTYNPKEGLKERGTARYPETENMPVPERPSTVAFYHQSGMTTGIYVDSKMWRKADVHQIWWHVWAVFVGGRPTYLSLAFPAVQVNYEPGSEKVYEFRVVQGMKPGEYPEELAKKIYKRAQNPPIGVPWKLVAMGIGTLIVAVGLWRWKARP